MLAGLLTCGLVQIKLAEAEVTVGDEGAHPSRLGDGQRLPVVGLAPFCIEAVGMASGVTEEVQRMGRKSRLAGREFDRAVAQAPRVVEPPQHQRSLARPRVEPSESADVSARGVTLETLLTLPQTAQGLGRLAELCQAPGGEHDHKRK